MAALPGLRDALKVVEEEAVHAREHGLSTFTFFLGLGTVVITAFLMGKYPASVWIVYAAEALAILGWRIYVDCHKKTPRTLLYFLDFCWVTNFVIATLCFVKLCEVLDEAFLGDTFPNSNLATQFPNVGRIVCLIATGPLGWSVLLLGNALVLHDIEHFSGCFIHLWPSLTTLTVRWNPELVMASYPGHFDSLTGFDDPTAGANFLELVQLAMSAYLVWWVPFTLWMLVHGRHQSPKKTGWDTVYLNLVVTNGAVRKVLGIGSNSGEDALLASASGIAPVVKYMIVHALLSLLSLTASAFCYKNMLLHLAFCVILVCAALYNASKRYEWMLTERYSRAIRKHIAKEFPSADSKENKDK